MTQLVLVSGFKDEAGANSKRLKDYIESSFPSYREVWMDPEKKPRAVIFFDEQLELKDFQKTCKGTEMCRYLEAVEQTHSVFVETYDCMKFGAKDKLKYLFTSSRHGGSPVLHVEHLNFDYYEIVFNSWDDVLKTCKQPWVVEKQTLCVTPYFQCFKEPFEAQMQRLIKLNSATRQIKVGSSSYTPPKRSVNLSSGVGNLINAPIKPLPRQPSLTELKLTEAAQHLTKGSPENQQNLSKSPGLYNPFSDSGASKAAETNISAVKQSCFPVERRADQKSAKPILEHPYILILLHLLNFEKAVQAHFDSTAVVIDTATSEIEITGPVSPVKIIQKFLTEKDEMEQGEVVVKFLANEAVHQDLKAYVYAEKLHVVINVKDKLSFEVQYGNNRTVSFDEFITSLVVTKECSPLPNEQSKKNIKWIEFMESFQKAYSHQHIFFQDTCVTLVSLAHMSQDIDVVSNIINNEIVQLNRHLHSGPTSETSTATTTNSVDETLGDGLTATSSSNSSEDTQSLQTNPLFRTITIFSQNCTLLWLLNVLNFRNAVKQLDSNLTVEIIENEQEITVNGPRKYVHHLKSIIMTLNKQFPLTLSLQELLSEAHIQEYLRACFNESKCHIVLNENSEMLVAYTNEEKEQRTTYLINLIEIRECACLPEKYHITKEWNSLVPSVKNSQPYVYVFTANDKAYVLLVAIRETLPDINLIVGDINSAISFLTSTPEEQVETKPALTPTSKEKFETKPTWTPTSKEKFETKPTLTPTSKEKFETKPTLTPTSKEKFETKPTLTSTLEEKPETKLALTSTLEEMVVDACSSDPLKDPTSTLNNIVKDKVQSSSHVIPEPAENAKKLKLKIIFKHPVLTWILDVLRLNEAVGEIGVFVNTDSETEISIRGPRDVVQGLQKTLMTQDNQMAFEDQCDEILSDVQVQQFLRLRLENLKAHIVLGDNLDLCTEIRSGEKTSLKNFFANFIHFQRCSDLPEMFHNTEQWEELVKKYQNHEFCCVLVRNDEVHLLTCALGQRSCDTDIIVQEINETISSFTSSVSHDFEMIEEPENHDIFFEYPEKKKLYCEKFLQKEIHKILERYKSYDAGIEDVANGFRIHSASQEMTHRLTNEIMEMLSTIIEKCKSLKFPCLDKFMKSAGSGLIETLSNEHKCQIEVSNSNGSNPRSSSTSGNMFPESSQRHEYTVTVLETAKCNGFNVHLVQGDMQDINVGMRVGFQSSDEVDVCDVKTVKSSKNVVIRLPRWYVANEISHLDNLRSSFQDTVKLTLEQAGHLKVSTMAFSTENLICAKDYSFPADVIAKIIVEKLIQHFGFDPVTSKKTYMQDIYICGKMNKAIFRAFTFFLKRRGAFIGPPNQASWDKVCPQESEEYSSYNSLKAKGLDIEVSSDFPSYKGKNACFFYPIQPTLETVSCPAMKDHHFQGGGLRTFLHEQEKQNPDGLLPIELFSMKGHQTGRLAFIYISPEWGMYSKQTIEWILDECIRFASDYEELYIVPPGVQMLSKYPVAYLAQTWFKHLDNLLLSPTFHVQKKKITFVVLEYSYRKAFEQELEKRLPRDHETGIIGKLWNYITGSDKGNDNQKNVPQSTTKVSRMPDTKVSFWCTGFQDFQKASMQLEKKLKELMATNTKEVHLNKTDTQNVQLLMKDMSEACALITFTETYKMKKKKNKLTGSILKLQGLCMDCVNNCLHILHLGSKITGKAKCNEETDMDMSVESNGNSSIPMETHSQPQQDDKLPPLKAAPVDVSSHSLTQMTSSFKWQYDANCNGQFGDIGSIGNDIEVAYSTEGKEFFNPPGDKIVKINFTTMTAVSKTNEKSIIRTEVFEKPQKDVHFPDSWSSMSNIKFAIKELEKEEWQNLQGQLEECLNANKLLLKQVSRVQNKTLYTRYSQKTSQLKVRDATTLWHKASNNFTDQICRFGFHPRFSGMPKAIHLGDGVLFYKEPDRCLSQPIKAEGKEVYLFMSRVLLGRCGPGRQGLRCPPSDESTGQPFNSVHGEDEAYMIFSDAQAYPEYMLTLERT